MAEIIRERMPPELSPLHREFDEDGQSWVCPRCHHVFETTFDYSLYHGVTTAPSGVVYFERACNDCRKRIDAWSSRHGAPSRPARRVRERSAAGGVAIDGIT